MLYKKAKDRQLEESLFRNPTSEYRGAPFWAWNGKLEKRTLIEQIEIFKEMGFGGFHIHSRTGLETPYLSDEFMDFVKLCNQKAIEEEMLCWLYDEDRYPSGAAGGMVTRDMRYRARHLLLSQKQYPVFEKDRETFDQLIQQGGKPKGYFLASYRIVLRDGYLAEYDREDRNVEKKESPAPREGHLWYAYVCLAKEDPWYNGQTYIDVLNPSAVRRFIEVTHQRYWKAVGSEFGKSVPAIFTDEPQVSCKSCMHFAESSGDVTISFTDDLPETYQKAYGENLLDVLPELFWELPEGRVSLSRYRYHNHLADRFASSYADTLGKWCEDHGIALTGHLMSERTLYSQTLAVGEAMRSYRSFQLPGIDILCDAKEFSTAKQAVSVAHQYGREGVLSELYGVTHWDYDFKGYKLQGDWQAALGITIRVPHLAYLSMEGESKRDWPPSIHYQSPWYREYSYVENHFARLNTALTRGKSAVRIGVIHPIESFWLSFGPNDQTGAVRAQYDEDFENLISWMLYGLLDFDFISEALLPGLCPEAGFSLAVGEMRYRTIVVPDCRTIRKTTFLRLKKFREAGGRVIFMGGIPFYMDVLPSGEPALLAKKCETIPFRRVSLLQALEPERVLDVRFPNGRRSDNLIYQLREDGEGKWLFLCHVNRRHNRLDQPEKYRIRVKGKYNPILYDTLTGEIQPCPAEIVNQDTVILRDMYAEDSLLLYLKKGVPSTAPGKAAPFSLQRIDKLQDPVSFTLSEPNVLLLDRAEYSFDQGEFHPAEEILRVDNQFRKTLGYPSRMDHMMQPWAERNPEPEGHLLGLRYSILSNERVSDVKLAMERPETAAIRFNGTCVETAADGFFTDKAIRTVLLPDLEKGENELLLEIPFGRRTNVEWCYLLGHFGVRVAGAHTWIEKAPEQLAFGDWVPQGLPFYTGNIIYQCPVTVKKEISDAVLEIPHFSAPVLVVHLDGIRKGVLAFAPHRLCLGRLAEGRHRIDITAYGNRFNAFGTLHNANEEYLWYGPDSYRTRGSQWTDSYLLHEMGIRTTPVLYERKKNPEE